MIHVRRHVSIALPENTGAECDCRRASARACSTVTARSRPLTTSCRSPSTGRMVKSSPRSTPSERARQFVGDSATARKLLPGFAAVTPTLRTPLKFFGGAVERGQATERRTPALALQQGEHIAPRPAFAEGGTLDLDDLRARLGRAAAAARSQAVAFGACAI